jgi:hypothetical protein
MKSLYALGLIALSLILLLALTSATCQKPARRANRYLIPDGYVGWVRVDYKIKNAPALPIEEGYYLIKFSPTGRVQTSTDMEEGYALDQYYYYRGDDKHLLNQDEMIRNLFTGRKGQEQLHEYFFVGTEKELKESGLVKDEDGYPKVGPISPIH